jgi:hypothetical protein
LGVDYPFSREYKFSHIPSPRDLYLIYSRTIPIPIGRAKK